MNPNGAELRGLVASRLKVEAVAKALGQHSTRVKPVHSVGTLVSDVDVATSAK